MDFSARLSLSLLPLRTNSDSALHTSALSTKPQDPYGGGGQSAWPASYVGKTRRLDASQYCAVLFCPRGAGVKAKVFSCTWQEKIGKTMSTPSSQIQKSVIEFFKNQVGTKLLL